jgi:two-component system, OmpR family, phosphate regulon sensor histidine kinase PhoR
MVLGPGLQALRRMQVPLAAAVVFAGLWLLGAIAPAPALAGFALIAAAALVENGRREAAPGKESEQARSTATNEPGGLQAVLSGLPYPVIALSRREEVIALNAEASAIAPALRRGQSVLLGLRAPEVLQVMRRARASRSAQHVELFERVPVERWYEVIAVPISLPERMSAGDLVLLTFQDRTPLRRVEAMRADFVANASHELRTPLAALSGFIETLQGPARDDAAARERFLDIMHVQADRMARLIDDLLSLSRIELREHLRPDQEVDVAVIVHQVADGLQALANERAVEIAITGPSSPLIVLGERDELMRVFENLVENALKYAASGKRVEIALTRAEIASGKQEARVAVRDHGPGIAAEHLPRLTERFYRVDVAESRAQGGTGLGLALVKHILNRHDGRLTIESTPGQGATFTVHLPLLLRHGL